MEINEICLKINKPSTANNSIIKIFQNFREIIRCNQHEECKNNTIGTEPSNNDITRVEIY